MYSLNDIPPHYYKDGDLIPYTTTEREELLEQWNEDAIRVQELTKLQYKKDRAAEYPSLADLADAMYWASRGDNTKLDNYYAACEAVKLKYPKSE